MDHNAETFAIKKEIESRIIMLDIKLKKEVLVSNYVTLLVEKRQLQEPLNQYNNEN